MSPSMHCLSCRPLAPYYGGSSKNRYFRSFVQKEKARNRPEKQIARKINYFRKLRAYFLSLMFQYITEKKKQPKKPLFPMYSPTLNQAEIGVTLHTPNISAKLQDANRHRGTGTLLASWLTILLQPVRLKLVYQFYLIRSIRSTFTHFLSAVVPQHSLTNTVWVFCSTNHVLLPDMETSLAWTEAANLSHSVSPSVGLNSSNVRLALFDGQVRAVKRYSGDDPWIGHGGVGVHQRKLVSVHHQR